MINDIVKIMTDPGINYPMSTRELKKPIIIHLDNNDLKQVKDNIKKIPIKGEAI